MDSDFQFNEATNQVNMLPMTNMLSPSVSNLFIPPMLQPLNFTAPMYPSIFPSPGFPTMALPRSTAPMYTSAITVPNQLNYPFYNNMYYH